MIGLYEVPSDTWFAWLPSSITIALAVKRNVVHTEPRTIFRVISENPPLGNRRTERSV